MCGLLFILERSRPVDEALARSALDGLRHRGPDASGFQPFTLPANGEGPAVHGAAGHRRLSIIDLDHRSDQPFRRGRHRLVYNGEIYNFRDLRRGLSEAGEPFHTGSDTEVLCALLARHGLDGLADANGMWAFCLLDEEARVVTAARDRYGKKPLYYYADAATVCFASEIAPILAYLGRRPALTLAGLDTYLAHGWLLPGATDATHIDTIRQVLPGSAVTFDIARWRLEAHVYDDIADRAEAPVPEESDLPGLIREAVLARLVSDRKVGLLLSGGIDSSLVLSVLRAEGLQDGVRCFTGDAGKSEDSDYARRCIEAIGIEARTVPLNYGPGSMDRFLNICRHQEKPFPFIGNALAMPEMYEAIAADDVPVVLDGTGGDEVFGGYWDRYYRFAVGEAADRGDESWLAESLAANADQPRIAAIAAETLERKRAHRPPAPPPASTVVAEMLRRYCPPELAHTPSSDPLTRFDGPLDQALILDSASGRMQEWLWQNDRNAMLASVENRSPLLDYRLAPLMRSGYARKFVGPWNKHELRQVFDAFAPLPTQWRREKQGFRWVFARFLRQNRSDVMDLLAGSNVLRARVQLDRVLDDLARDQELLYDDFMHRLVCVAGLDAAMGLTLAEDQAPAEAAFLTPPAARAGGSAPR